MRAWIVLIAEIFVSLNVYAAYDQSWYKAKFWSGEWPPGFSVAKEGVKVPARAAMNLDLQPTIQCELPFKALFNPWNSARTELSQVEYMTASKIVTLTAKEDFEFTDANSDQVLLIKEGHRIEYLVYGSEGYFVVRINGQEHVAGQDLFDHMESVSNESFDEHQWLRLNCVGDEVAWIYRSDLFSVDDDGNARYLEGLWNASIGDPGVEGYGEARDLTDDDLAGRH